MISVQIGNGPEMNVSEISEGWINQQVVRRQHDEQRICVKVTIQKGSLHMLLATKGCSGISYSRERPTVEEQRILDLWASSGMNKETFVSENLVAFLQQLQRMGY